VKVFLPNPSVPVKKSFKKEENYRIKNDKHTHDNPIMTNFELPKRNAFQCQICEIRKFGSDRREIFIALAQSGSANSPHSQHDMVRFIPKNYRFIYDFISILFYR
jgi:hypothetical protein